MWLLLALQRWDKSGVEQGEFKSKISPPYPFSSVGYLLVFEDYPTALKASDYHPERLTEIEKEKEIGRE
jgi:hypothetical protein